MNSPAALPPTPAFPSASSILPAGESFNTCWPLPASPRPSATQMLSSRSTCRPWGYTNIPAPMLRRSLPDASNSRTGATSLPMQSDAPQRSATQTWPRESTSMALDWPRVRPCGKTPKRSSAPYGFGAGACRVAEVCVAAVPIATARTGTVRATATATVFKYVPPAPKWFGASCGAVFPRRILPKSIRVLT